MAQYEELKPGLGLADRYKTYQASLDVQKLDSDYYKHSVSAIERSKGSSEARRKYELAKRDYAKASLLGKVYLKLTGQANFKKMLEEANKRSR